MWGWEEKKPLFSLRNSDIPEDSGRHLDNLFLGDAVSLKQRNMYCTVQYTHSCPFLCKSQDVLLLMLGPGISPPSLSFFVKPIWERGPIRVEGAWKENSPPQRGESFILHFQEHAVRISRGICPCYFAFLYIYTVYVEFIFLLTLVVIIKTYCPQTTLLKRKWNVAGIPR